MLSLVRKWWWGLFLEEMEEKVEKSASPDGVSFRVVKFEDLNSSENWKMARFHNHSGHACTRRYSKVDNLSMCFDFRGTIVSFLWDFWATWSKEVPVLCELANNVVNLCTNNIYTSMFYKALNKMFERNLVPSQQIIFSLKLFYLFIYLSIVKGRQRWIHRVRSTIYSCTSPKCQKKKKIKIGQGESYMSGSQFWFPTWWQAYSYLSQHLPHFSVHWQEAWIRSRASTQSQIF